MRKLIAIEFLSLDGVIQAPGGPEEDLSGGFAHGGWIAPYSEPLLSAAIKKEMDLPFDLLLGRKTFEIWAPYWPLHAELWPGVNAAVKFVASTTLSSHAWGPTRFLSGDIAGKILELKREKGPDLHLYGSAGLLGTLLKEGLVDAFWLKIFPLILGGGKRLFAEAGPPAAFRLTESQVSPKGVIMAKYELAGPLLSGGS